MWARATAALAGPVVAVLLSACSIGTQSSPVPAAAPTATSSTTGPSRQGVPLTIQVYLVQGDRLARVTRTVPPGAGLEPSFVGLAVPVTPTMAANGIRNALPIASTPLRGVVDEDGVARIELPSGFERISVHEQSLAMAQLVFTVTANSLAQSVQLVQGTRELPVPGPSGQLVNRPVTRVDYAAYNPPT
ncbi:Sporulation and spore germination [Pedococcus dokdonensis]|uniref:Sporulation and spore germination n=1 Tax=Pedococcus dokdonensis TaxID=443156 RepID=A0A1H0PA13_9MICO|nr:GerMN domain-containing protein [Pedococcus dokdonensis]SDP01466.1 Sporulation and spore germination [Pedococcus dokdonensis]